MATTVRPPVRWRFSAFDPLSFVAFPDYPHDLPARKWLKCLPFFAGGATNWHIYFLISVVKTCCCSKCLLQPSSAVINLLITLTLQPI
jgi:hypothetical protein